jgi:hypothetical protein
MGNLTSQTPGLMSYLYNRHKEIKGLKCFQRAECQILICKRFTIRVMKSFTVPLLAIVAAAMVMGIVTVGMQQTYAPRDCGSCVAFKKLTHEYEKNVINAIGDPNISPGPRELLSAYVDDVIRIFLGGPDTIPGLLEQYQTAVLAVLQNPPDPDKQEKNEQIKEFRQLTKDFEGAVAAAIIAATQDNN